MSLSHEESIALAERLSSELESARSRMSGVKDSIRIALLHALLSETEEIGREHGRSSPAFDATRRLTERLTRVIEEATKIDEG